MIAEPEQADGGSIAELEQAAGVTITRIAELKQGDGLAMDFDFLFHRIQFFGFSSSGLKNTLCK